VTVVLAGAAGARLDGEDPKRAAPERWKRLAPHFSPPKELAGDLGDYRSPLRFDDGQAVKTPEDWKRRRGEIRGYWDSLLGRWPALLERPEMKTLAEEKRQTLSQRKVKVQAAADLEVEGYVLTPDGAGPFPAVLVVFYDPETGAGLKPEAEFRDFGYQLSRRGFVTLSIGWPRAYTDAKSPAMQPLSSLAYVAANCRKALAGLPQVDPKRIGICGHSFGGKWALFAAALDDEFACGAWSDPGIVFDERRPNVNYWEPWYLGWDPERTRKPGVPSAENPRTGPYAKLVEAKRDLHELMALVAPRPFLVSGGSEDPPERWKALNHVVAVNRLLGHENRVAMTNRPGHSPTKESNEILYEFFEQFLEAR
jgi:hypothetical protein